MKTKSNKYNCQDVFFDNYILPETESSVLLENENDKHTKSYFCIEVKDKINKIKQNLFLLENETNKNLKLFGDR